MTIRLPCNFNEHFQIHEEGRSLSIGDLEEFSKRNSESLRKLFDKRICIKGSPFHVIKWLIISYGYSDQIYICNQNISEDEAEVLIKNYVPEIIITDCNFLPVKWADVPVLELDNNFDINDDNLSSLRKLDSKKSSIVLSTSGTTSTPKLIRNSLEGLTRTVSKSTRNKNSKWGLFYEPSRFAGLQVVFQSIFGGGELIVNKPNQSLEETLEFYIKNGCNSISATPSLWKKLCMLPNFKKLSLTQITLGGEIVQQSILNHLSNIFPVARVVHIYASTEAGACLTVTDKKEGFPVEWLNGEINNLRFKISKENTLCFYSKSFKQEYLNPGISIYDEGSWIDSGDVVQIINGRVCFKGRLNGTINVGGNKVFPEEIERVISQVAGVLEVVVSSKKSSILGNLVLATVKVEQGRDNRELKSLILEKCKLELADYKVPALIKFSEDIDLSSGLKIKRNG